jgi:hypothetical protein
LWESSRLGSIKPQFHPPPRHVVGCIVQRA